MLSVKQNRLPPRFEPARILWPRSNCNVAMRQRKDRTHTLNTPIGRLGAKEILSRILKFLSI